MSAVLPGRHQCPGPDCTRQVTNEMLACPRHWFALSKPTRDAVYAAYRRHGAGSSEHAAAVAGAMEEWYG